MGNISSCFYVESQLSGEAHRSSWKYSEDRRLIDLHGNILRIVDVPMTAAELMLEKPGHVVSMVIDARLSAMKAEETLSAGEVYILIPLSRVQGKLSESKMAGIEIAVGKRRAKRRSSRVLPLVTEISGESVNNPVKVLGEGSDNGILSYRMRQWTPSLEPIHEGIGLVFFGPFCYLESPTTFNFRRRIVIIFSVSITNLNSQQLPNNNAVRRLEFMI